MGLSAAAGQFAKVRMQLGGEGKFVVVVMLFCDDSLLTPCPCPCRSLLANAAVAGDIGRWFVGRDNIVATKVSFV